MLRASILLVLLGAFAPSAAAQGPPPSPVGVEAVASERVAERRRVTGEVRTRRRARLAAREAGYVVELAVEEGQPVEAGAVLARLDDRKLRLELARAEADAARAREVVVERRAATRLAEADLAALEGLDERGATNVKELRDARFEVERTTSSERQARHEAAALRAVADLLAERIADLEVRAPWSGRVVAKLTEVGEWLELGAEVCELVSLETLEVQLVVPQQYFGSLASGEGTLELVLDSTGTRLLGTSPIEVPTVDPRARTFRVTAALEPRPELAPGMSVTAWVPTGAEAERLLVPRSAILRNEVGPYVYLVVPGDEGAPASAMLVPISVEFSVGDRAVVSGPGLVAGASVVTEGNERLYPMAPITPLGGDVQGGAAGGAQGR